MSLTEARRNFRAPGACDERCTQFVRAPPAERTLHGLTSPAAIINVIGRRRIPAIGNGLRTARWVRARAIRTAGGSNS
ncbi:CPCC family cysteine-rich protein [Streptomyces sp. NPDC059861]|uniref:CPCC family cysteine-rich protein n=1 Tax=Streptomyces sp. NPDC059861 TaxID=3346974 RepID=UPI003657EECF